MSAASSERLTSIANLVGHEWVITSTDFPDITTCGLWLGDTLTAHRGELRRHSAVDVCVKYRIEGRDIDGSVQHVREAMEWLHEAYRLAKTYDVTTRPERYALLEQLSADHVMPSEMALMLGVDLQIAERFAGDDQEARIARRLLHQMSTTNERITA
ncbi:hypothetical protein AX769_21950 (plasmid) [Frondihabitans sp. PAMC 28766]|nr:hypothetical protein AX769_21950 [Frondihabitans sp. PAMC 28766]